MAFKKVVTTESGSLPFFSDWEKKLSPAQKKAEDTNSYCALSIKEVRSGKGFMVNFSNFALFIWKNSTDGKLLTQLFEEESGDHFGVVLEHTKQGLKSITGFFDDEVVYYHLEKPECEVLSFKSQAEHQVFLDEKEESQKRSKEREEASEKIKQETMKSLSKPATH